MNADGAAPIGVQIFEADVDTDAVARIREAGATWARVRALWKLVEPRRRTPPTYDWTVTDRLFGDTTAAGLRNLAAVYANPSWAADTECGPVRASEVPRYASLWQALVERYDGDGVKDAPNGALVRDWQVGNEVDFDPSAAVESDYGSCFGDRPEAYAEELVVAYRAAKAADADARVGFGPIAFDRFSESAEPAGWAAPAGPYRYAFTREAIEHLYEGHTGDPDLPFFDFVGLHNYNDNGHLWDDPASGARELVAKAAAFRATQLVRPSLYDLRSTPIVVSESGLASSPSDEYTDRSEDLQAAYVAQTMVRGMAAGARAVIWYTARDNIFGDCRPPHWDWLTFGLMRSSEYAHELATRCPLHPWAAEPYDLASGSASPRPALGALSWVTRMLHGAAFDRQVAPSDVAGQPFVEAYRFVEPDGSARLAAWTTTGQRLGKRGIPALEGRIEVDARTVVPWTGQVWAVDRAGPERELGEPGSTSVAVDLGPEPVFLGASQPGP